MIWHPLILSALVLDSIVLILLTLAALSSIRIVLGWDISSVDRTQILLEAESESASILGRAAFVLLMLASTTLIIVVTNTLPALVPGAMCGTGVLQASAGLGERALVTRLLAALLLFVWFTMDGLNRRHALAPASVASARGLLLAYPVVCLSVIDTVRAANRLELHEPVDCCTLVYDQVRPAAQTLSAGSMSAQHWLVAFLIVSMVLVGLGGWLWRRPFLGSSAIAFGIVSLCWSGVASIALTQTFSVYIYQVLNHHCPWCLFLPEHWGVGFLLFGAVFIVAAEGAAVLTSSVIWRHFPLLEFICRARMKRSVRSVLLGAVTFSLIAGIPAFVWRVRFGVWLN